MLPWHRLHEFPVSFYQHKPLCVYAYGLSRSQLSLCHQHFDHMPVIGVGARIGIQQCEEQFKYHHWNCSSAREPFALGSVARHGKYVIFFLALLKSFSFSVHVMEWILRWRAMSVYRAAAAVHLY
ncbi:unnamed protein product [Schistocephalus solidus]|uniref:Protein Wnt n=1 Tax=Schistocephalus solidus TaxID=70667 RepID=A0A183S994_SCHSO|nr:unnamed protein product [Schistocephalus solidus]